MLILKLLVAGVPLVSASGPSDGVSECPNPVASSLVQSVAAPVVYDLVVDSLGRAVTTGFFYSIVDFDPGEGEDFHSSSGFQEFDAFVTWLDSDATYQWTRDFGGTMDDQPLALTATNESIVVVGSFAGTADFDPGPLEESYTAIGSRAAFVLRLDESGGYVGVYILGQGVGAAGASCVASDPSNNVLVAGSFQGSLDFDPTAATDSHAAYPESQDAFLTKIYSDGSYGWTQTFGGPGFDYAESVATDLSGNVVIAGGFRASVDFDPSPEEDFHYIVGGYNDIFLTKLSADGSYQWTRTLPPDLFSGPSIATDQDGNIVVSSAFEGTVDFDPGDGVDSRTATTEFDLFITKLSGSGDYVWTQTFDGEARITPTDLTVDQNDNLVLAGVFSGWIDFDPGLGSEVVESSGITVDAFILMLSGDGEFRWVRTFGDHEGNDETIIGLGVDPDGNVIAAGHAHAATPTDLRPGCARETFHDPGKKGNGVNFIIKLACVEASPDANGDGVLDLLDVACFQNCFTGDPPQVCPTGCEALDFDHDDDIDLVDFNYSSR